MTSRSAAAWSNEDRLPSAPASPALGLARLADLEGLAALETTELLGLLLGGSTDDGWGAWLAQLGGLAGLGAQRPEALARTGLGKQRALRLCAALELGRRHVLAPSRGALLRPLDAAAVAAWACPRLGQLEHEEVWVLCVDGRVTLRSSWQVGRGGLHGCSLLPRDVLVPVVRQAASGFILVHNHPSGDPTPSLEDVELTRTLSRAALLVGSPLIDHVIIAGSRHTSMAPLEPSLAGHGPR